MSVGSGGGGGGGGGGGTGVSVGVSAGGTGVAVGGSGVAVGGTGVAVGGTAVGTQRSCGGWERTGVWTWSHDSPRFGEPAYEVEPRTPKPHIKRPARIKSSPASVKRFIGCDTFRRWKPGHEDNARTGTVGLSSHQCQPVYPWRRICQVFHGDTEYLVALPPPCERRITVARSLGDEGERCRAVRQSYRVLSRYFRRAVLVCLICLLEWRNA